MKRKLSLEFRTGLFVILAVLLLLTFIFSQGRASRIKGYQINVAFNYVGGLERGAPVLVAGVRVGEVAEIAITGDPNSRVLVTAKIGRGVRIGANSVCTIRTLGMIGEKYLEITPSYENRYVAAGQTLHGEDPMPMERIMNMGEDIIRNLNAVLSDVRQVTGDRATQQNLKSILANTNKAVENASGFLTEASRLTASLQETSRELQDMVAANRSRIDAALVNVNDVMTTAKSGMETTMRKIEEFADEGRNLAVTTQAVMTTLDDKIGDLDTARLQDEFLKTNAEVRSFVERVQTQGSVARLLKDDALYEEALKSVQSLGEAAREARTGATNLARLSDDAGQIVSHVKQGRGTVGKLLISEELYKEVNDFLRDIMAHPWKLLIRKPGK